MPSLVESCSSQAPGDGVAGLDWSSSSCSALLSPVFLTSNAHASASQALAENRVNASESQTLAENKARASQSQASAESEHTHPANLITVPRAIRPQVVVAKIEQSIQPVIHGLSNGAKALPIRFQTRRSEHARRIVLRSASRNTQVSKPSVVSFPGRTLNEAKKFAGILAVLHLSHAALVKGHVITKRNIYYQCGKLFSNQRVVDDLVDDLAFTLGLGRNALNIVADGRGLISGHAHLHMEAGSVTSCSSPNEQGIFIPPLQSIRQINVSSARWILVVEKEATFRTLIALRYWDDSKAGQGILVTSKGQPDLATRSFLGLVHSARPNLPIFALVDYDPYGFIIFHMYKCGSLSLDHEERAAVSGIRWLGIRSGDLLDLKPSDNDDNSQQLGSSQDSQLAASQSSLFSDGRRTPASRTQHQKRYMGENLAFLTPCDRNRAAGAIRTICGKARRDPSEIEQIRELQVMMMLNIKAGIHAVDNHGNLSDWLDQRLCEFWAPKDLG